MSVVFLYERNFGVDREVQAELRIDVTLADLATASREWQSFRQQAVVPGIVGNDLPLDSAYWNWLEKGFRQDADDVQFLSVTCMGKSQGLMSLSRATARCRFPESSSENLLYIHYLETAPWNQPVYAGGNVSYKGVGSALLYAAIERSVQAGCGGALGLHSLPEAEGYYRNLQFLDGGLDEKHENLRYFELDKLQAAILQEGD